MALPTGVTGENTSFGKLVLCLVFCSMLACFLLGVAFSVALFGGLLLCVYDMWLGLWLGLSAGPGGGFCLPFVCMEKFLLELVVV
jgi:hypothetical protein